MYFIAVKNNKIIYVCDSSSEDQVVKALEYEGIAEYDLIQPVANENFEGKVGEDIREYSENWILLPLFQRKDFVEIPEGMKIENNEFVEMTVKEKIDAGITILTGRQIYDVDQKIIRDKTIYELAETKEISIDSLKKYQSDIISKAFDHELQNGHFMSNILGIEVDCRRSSTKNDLQNVQGLIDHLQRNGKTSVSYFGYADRVLATVSQLEDVIKEMQDYFLVLYEKKWLKESQILSATMIEQVKAIVW
jgi:hypothetical protein